LVHDPAIFEGRVFSSNRHSAQHCGINSNTDLGGAVHVHEKEARGIPNLIGEGAITFGAGDIEGDVGSRRSHRGQCESNRIRPVLLDDFDGINHVALGLGHLFAVGVAHQGVNVNLSERYRIRQRALASIGHGHVGGKPAAEHNHARHPEEENVEAGH